MQLALVTRVMSSLKIVIHMTFSPLRSLSYAVIPANLPTTGDDASAAAQHLITNFLGKP